jgi:hypothetical protein
MYVDRRHRIATSRVAFVAFHLLTFASVAFGLGATALAQPPGPELFAKEPKTPLELWDAVDYLLRTNQAKKAVSYLDKFVKSKPDDATWIAIRSRFGPASVLQLSDDAATRPFAQPIAEAMATAARKYATRPERIAQFITELTKTPEEQNYAVRHLREAGPNAVPYLVDALSRPDLTPEHRKLLVASIGRLDRSAIPALAAVLDSPEPVLASATATALGMIGNSEAIPFLTFSAAAPGSPPAVRMATQTAIVRLTGKPFSAQPRTPVQVLTDAAWRYHRHQVEFPVDPAVIWTWDNDRKAPVPREVSRTEAEEILGMRLAKAALRLAPNNRDAQVVQLSLALEKAIERVGFASFPAKDQATFTAAKASGPAILSEVLKTAIADGKTDLAAGTVMVLTQVTDHTALAAMGRPHPLVDGLYAPGAPCPVRSRQSHSVTGADRAISRLKPGRPHACTVRNQPGSPASCGHRRQP